MAQRYEYRIATADDAALIRSCAMNTFLVEYGTVALPQDTLSYLTTAYSIETFIKEITNSESLYYIGIDNAPTIPQIQYDHLDPIIFEELNANHQPMIDPVDENKMIMGPVCIGFMKLSWGAQQICENYRQRNDTIELQRVYVRKEYQNIKVGTTLLQFGIQYALHQVDLEGDDKTKSKWTTMWLTVLPTKDDAVRFYHRHGFVHTGYYNFQLGDKVVVDSVFERQLV